MPKHEFGTVYCFPPTEDDRTVCIISISKKIKDWTVYETPAEPQAAGRHRVETVPTNIATVFVTAPPWRNGPVFECVREYDGDMAIGFEYLPV